MSPFNISCQLVGDIGAALLDCLDFTVGIPTIAEHTILIPYNSGLRNGNDITFRLIYSYRLCSAYEQINFTGKYGRNTLSITMNVHLINPWHTHCSTSVTVTVAVLSVCACMCVCVCECVCV